MASSSSSAPSALKRGADESGAGEAKRQKVVGDAMLSLTTVRLDDAARFDDEVAKARAGRVLVYVTASAKRETHQPWCPDCARANPVVARALEADLSGDVTLIEVPLARDGYKGNAQHPLRVHPRLKLTAIPTLFKWPAAESRLVEGDCSDAQKLKAFLAAE